MLKVENLYVNYGHVQVLKDINIEVSKGEIVTIIGSNGSGKSTLLRCISGVVPAKTGTIKYMDQNINRMQAEKIVRTGISHIPEGRQLFSGLTVLENLELGAYGRHRRDGRSAVKGDLESIFDMFSILKERSQQSAGTLSGGEQQMLAIGRALMSRPQLLLLDEPSMGLAPLIIKNIFKSIEQLREQGITILLVEQDVGVALSISDRGYVLQNGACVMHDTGENLLKNDEVKAIYFGSRKHAH